MLHGLPMEMELNTKQLWLDYALWSSIVLGFRFIFKFPHAELRTRMGSNTFSVQVNGGQQLQCGVSLLVIAATRLRSEPGHVSYVLRTGAVTVRGESLSDPTLRV